MEQQSGNTIPDNAMAVARALMMMRHGVEVDPEDLEIFDAYMAGQESPPFIMHAQVRQAYALLLADGIEGENTSHA